MSKWIHRLEYRFRRFGVDNLMIYVTGTMLAVYIAENLLSGLARTSIYGLMGLSRELVLSGQVWRLLTFVFLPPQTGMILWVLIGLYFYYFIGSSLENVWGRTRFTIYYLFGVLGAIIAAFISGHGTNMYLNLSMFLAFAALFPEHQVMLFFVLPIKIKYLAYLDAVLLLLAFVSGGWAERAAILASLANLLLFFGDNFMNWLKDWKRYGKNRLNFRKNARNYKDYWR
jgi:membrane associated rhomboid family serine protease